MQQMVLGVTGRYWRGMFCGWRLALLSLVLLLGACETADDGSTVAGRELVGLERCSVLLPGHWYLGLAIPYTGSLSGYASAILHGIELAVDEINEAGGVHGETLGIVNCDTRIDPHVSLDIVRELGAQAFVTGIIGPLTSENVIAVHGAVPDAGKPLLSPSATSPALAGLDDDGYVFSTTVTDSYQGTVLARIAADEGLGKVFVAHRNDSWGRGLSEVFVEEYERLGGETRAYPYNPNARNTQEIVDGLRAYGADRVLAIAFLDDAAAIIKSITNAGERPAWLLTDGSNDGQLLTKIGDAALIEGAIGVSPSPPRGAEYDTFAAAYRTLIGEEPSSFATNAYDAVFLLAIAMALVDDPEQGTTLRDALANATSSGPRIGPGEWFQVLAAPSAVSFDYAGASGPVDFNEHGEVLGDIREWRVIGGEIVSTNCHKPEGGLCPER